MPGVSTKIIWDFDKSSNEYVQIPLTQNLVVWTLWDTIETFFPTNLFIKVDFPEFGMPSMFTKPDLDSNLFKLSINHFFSKSFDS